MENRNKLFVIVFGIMFFCLPIISFVVQPPEKIPSQNRISVNISKFSVDSYMDGTFQTALEAGLKDRIVGTNKLRDFYYNTDTQVNLNLSKALSKTLGMNYVILNNSFYYDTENDFYNRLNMFTSNGSCDLQYSPEVLNQVTKYIEDSNVESENVYTFLIDRRRQIDPITKEFMYSKTTADTLNNCNSEYVKNYQNIYNIVEQDSYQDVLNVMIPSDNHWSATGNEKGYKEIEEVLYNDNVISTKYEVDKDYDMYESTYVGSLASRAFLSEPSYTDKNLKYQNLDGTPINLDMTYTLYDPLDFTTIYDWKTTYKEFEWQLFQNRLGYKSDRFINVSTNRENLPNVLLIGDSFDDRIYNDIALNFNNTTVLPTLYSDDIALNIEEFSKKQGIKYDYVIVTSLSPIE